MWGVVWASVVHPQPGTDRALERATREPSPSSPSRRPTVEGRFCAIVVPFLAALQFAVIASAADGKLVDVRVDRRNATEATASYQIIFCARRSKAQSDGVGHAFIVWAKADEKRRFSIARAYGFYPGEGEKTKGVFGDVPGAVKNEATESNPAAVSWLTHRLIVEVNGEIWEKTQKHVQEWKTTDYNLFQNNCTHFCQAVALDLGIVVQRKNSELPSSFMVRAIDAATPAKN